MRPYIISLLSLSISVIALAVSAAHLSNAADEATRIEIDQQGSVIRFVVDGEEAARVDAAGLHTNGNVTLRGTLLDLDPYEDGSTAGGRQ